MCASSLLYFIQSPQHRKENPSYIHNEKYSKPNKEILKQNNLPTKCITLVTNEPKYNHTIEMCFQTGKAEHKSLPTRDLLTICEWVIELVYLTSLIYSEGPMSDGPGPGNEMKDERAPDLNTPGCKHGTQWSEVECSTARPSALRCW